MAFLGAVNRGFHPVRDDQYLLRLMTIRTPQPSMRPQLVLIVFLATEKQTQFFGYGIQSAQAAIPMTDQTAFRITGLAGWAKNAQKKHHHQSRKDSTE